MSPYVASRLPTYPDGASTTSKEAFLPTLLILTFVLCVAIYIFSCSVGWYQKQSHEGIYIFC